MPITKRGKIYCFAELSQDAKQTAIQSYADKYGWKSEDSIFDKDGQPKDSYTSYINIPAKKYLFHIDGKLA